MGEAGALPSVDLTHPTPGALGVAVAGAAARVAVVAHVALVAVRRQELRPALALARTLGAVARREVEVALARVADVGRIQGLVVRSVESCLALVAVDSLGVVLATAAHATTVVYAVNVEALLLRVNLLVVVAVV